MCTINWLEDASLTKLYVLLHGRMEIPSLQKSLVIPLHIQLHPMESCRIDFSFGKLIRLHSQLFYPTPTKIFNLLNRTNTFSVGPETIFKLKKISENCDPFQRVASPTLRF